MHTIRDYAPGEGSGGQAAAGNMGVGITLVRERKDGDYDVLMSVRPSGQSQLDEYLARSIRFVFAGPGESPPKGLRLLEMSQDPGRVIPREALHAIYGRPRATAYLEPESPGAGAIAHKSHLLSLRIKLKNLVDALESGEADLSDFPTALINRLRRLLGVGGPTGPAPTLPTDRARETRTHLTLDAAATMGAKISFPTSTPDDGGPSL